MGDIKILLGRIGHSPTIMTYGSFLTRSLGVILLLPFLLTQLSSEEIYLWYLFASISSLQLLIDLGFSPTFSRAISYAMGGADVNMLKKPAGDADGSPNWHTLRRICRYMEYVYSRLGVVWFVLLLLLGTLTVIHPISFVGTSYSAWLAWSVMLVSSTISFVGFYYSSYLQGVNEIALFRRWEVVTSVCSTSTCILVLMSDGGLLAVILIQQFWIIVSVIRNRWLSLRVLDGRMREFGVAYLDKKVAAAIWPAAWRTGIGVLSGYGLVQVSGIIYAQIVSPTEAASYFLSIRLIQLVSQFSQAPFYSKLPMIARLYSEGEKGELVRIARRGMVLAYLSFVLGFAILGSFGSFIFDLIGSNVDFPSFWLWTLFGLAYFMERYGAMHINLYSATNHIINHIANFGSGLIFITLGTVGYQWVGIYAIPLALTISNVGFYAWYAAKHSYQEFNLSFLDFERTAMLPYLGVLMIYLIVVSCT